MVSYGAQDLAFVMLDELFRGPFMASPQYKEFADENMGFEVPPMNPDRLAELARYGIEIVVPATAAADGYVAGAGAGFGSGAGAGAGAAAGSS